MINGNGWSKVQNEFLCSHGLLPILASMVLGRSFSWKRFKAFRVFAGVACLVYIASYLEVVYVPTYES